jgi:hypothetical protein
VIVHEGAWRHEQGRKATAWLESRGATVLLRADEDVLLALP